MKNTALTILISITLALVCVLLGFNFLQSTEDRGALQEQENIMVSGQGKITVDPDIAYLSLGYENIDKDSKKAQENNSKKMIEITNSLLEKGIKEENIQTVEYDFDEEYVWDGNVGEHVLVGYRVKNIIFVKVEELKTAEDIINSVFDTGANVFTGISFTVENKQELYQDAMEIAIVRAEEKASIYAQQAGNKISGVMQIVESSSENISTTRYSHSSSFNNYLALSYARSREGLQEEAIMATPSADAISTGQVEIIASVRITYGLK